MEIDNCSYPIPLFPWIVWCELIILSDNHVSTAVAITAQVHVILKMNFMLIYKAIQLAPDSNKTKRDSQEGEKIILSYDTLKIIITESIIKT
jgi:hypothetical protein